MKSLSKMTTAFGVCVVLNGQLLTKQQTLEFSLILPSTVLIPLVFVGYQLWCFAGPNSQKSRCAFINK